MSSDDDDYGGIPRDWSPSDHTSARRGDCGGPLRKRSAIETASQNKLLHHEYNEEYGV